MQRVQAVVGAAARKTLSVRAQAAQSVVDLRRVLLQENFWKFITHPAATADSLCQALDTALGPHVTAHPQHTQQQQQPMQQQQQQQQSMRQQQPAAFNERKRKCPEAFASPPARRRCAGQSSLSGTKQLEPSRSLESLVISDEQPLQHFHHHHLCP
jgi:hypothetical protein